MNRPLVSPRRPQSAFSRPQDSPASQHSNTDEDADEELSCALNGRIRNGIAAPASQSPGVSASSCTSQQQQKQPPVQQISQQLQQQAQLHHSQQNNTQTASGITAAPAGPISGGEVRRISCEDIQVVQNLIERCLQLYMNRDEVINTLLYQAKIEPGFTGLVWQKLEEQNPDFFKAYYVRLKLKKQIMIFNHLLEQHAQLTQKMHPAKATLPTMQNGIHASQVHHLPIGYPVPQQPPIAATSHPHIMQMPAASLSSPVLSGAPVPDAFGAHGSNGVVDMSSDISLLPTASGIPLNNDLSMGPGAVLHNSSAFPFTAVGNPTDMPGIGMDVPPNFPPDAPFHSSENHAQNGIGTIHMNTDADANGVRDSLGLLGQLPRNFSLSDLTAELTSSTDILGSYTGSPFLSPDADVFIHSPDDDMLDQVTDSCGCDDFEDEK